MYQTSEAFLSTLELLHTFFFFTALQRTRVLHSTRSPPFPPLYSLSFLLAHREAVRDIPCGPPRASLGPPPAVAEIAQRPVHFKPAHRHREPSVAGGARLDEAKVAKVQRLPPDGKGVRGKPFSGDGLIVVV